MIVIDTDTMETAVMQLRNCQESYAAFRSSLQNVADTNMETPSLSRVYGLAAELRPLFDTLEDELTATHKAASEVVAALS